MNLRNVRYAFVAKSLISVAGIALAVLMVALIAIPVSVWRHPVIDATYRGFDPNLMFVSAAGPSNASGTVTVTQSALTIIARAGSHPTVHLVTTPLTFSAAFDVEINAADPHSVPLRIGVWSPVTRAGYFLVFDRDGGNVLRAQTIVNGTAAQDLVGGTVRTNDILGQFATGHTVHVTFDVDKLRRTITTHVEGRDTLPPAGAHALQVAGPPHGALLLTSSQFPVSPGHRYSYGGWVESAASEGAHALGISWFDRSGRPLPSNDAQLWHGPGELTVWTEQSSEVPAPSQAAAARVLLGVAPGSTYQFGGIFVQDSAGPGPNLVRNGSFDSALSDWERIDAAGRLQPLATGHDDAIGTMALDPLDATSTITQNEAPEVVDAFRPTLTMSASSQQGGAAVAVVSNYILTIPSQPAAAAEESERVNDASASLITQLLLIAAVSLTVIAVAYRLAQLLPWHRPATTWQSLTELRRNAGNSTLGLVLMAAVLYLVVNWLLFRVASVYDVQAAKIWAYVAIKSGVPDLYYRPLLVTSAVISNGVPFHEAVFPYGVSSAYFYQLVGWLGRWLHPTDELSVYAFSLEALLKTFNVLFGLADGLLTYLILRRLVSRSASIQSAAILLLNPAVVFVMSVWGSTETFSLFFVLASIWLAEEKRPQGAYLMLAVAAFTRPQMFVLAFLLGLIYLRKFGVTNSLVPISWTVIAFFVALAPFALSISPSLPIDYVSRTLSYHFANGQADPNYLGLSPGYYSVWTLPLELVSGQHGLARMWAPSTLAIYGSLTYGQLAAGMSAVFVLALGAFIVAFRRLTEGPGQYLPLLAFGMLGWLMLTPGLISRYFVYAIALFILSRKNWDAPMYVWIVSVLTAITFLTAYGHLGLDALGNGVKASLLNPTNNGISRVIFSLFSDDRIITAGTIANVLILAMIGAVVLRVIRSGPAVQQDQNAEARPEPVVAG